MHTFEHVQLYSFIYYTKRVSVTLVTIFRVSYSKDTSNKISDYIKMREKNLPKFLSTHLRKHPIVKHHKIF